LSGKRVGQLDLEAESGHDLLGGQIEIRSTPSQSSVDLDRRVEDQLPAWRLGRRISGGTERRDVAET
jgi:hypothetical protein